MSYILVIEDHSDVRENTVDLLRLAGHDARGAATGTEGVRMAIEALPSLILCDVMMPELDGYGVLKILGERDDTRGVPFVFVTAKGEQDNLRRGMNLGADDYITRPFYKDELLQVVEVRLRKRAVQGAGGEAAGHTWSGFLSAAAAERGLDELLRDAPVRTYRRGEAMYRRGEVVRDLCYIDCGYAKVQRTTDFGKTLILGVVAPASLFGYPELVADRSYEHEAVALTPMTVRAVPAERLRERLASDANVANLLLTRLADQLLRADARTLAQSYLSVRKRCADTLLRAATLFGGDSWPMNREELSQWAGTAKETFIRNLTEFREAGYLETTPRAIRVLDVGALEAIPS